MSAILKRMYDKAQEIGHCGMIRESDRIEEWIALLRSPQGIEFCEKHDFPGLDIWREISHEYPLSDFGIYIDAGHVSLSNKHHVMLVGNTVGELHYDKLRRYSVVLANGARANIVADGYAVVSVRSDGTSSYEPEQKNNSRIL